MAEQQPNATANPPAPGGGIDSQALATAIGAALAQALPTAIAQANQPLIEAVTKLQGGQAGGQQQGQAGQQGQGGQPKALTLEDLTRVLDQRDQQSRQTAQQAQARQAFVQERMKNLPAVYQDRLGTDPAKWETEAKSIGDQFKADFKLAGGTTPDVGGTNPGGGKPADAVDLTKNNPVQNIALGLKQAQAAGPNGATTRTQPGQSAAAGA